MAMRMGCLVIAVSLTIFDAVVTVHFGWPVWVAWSGDILGRGLLIMMTALAATSLANVWAQAISRIRSALMTQSAPYVAVALPIERRGQHHV